MSLWESLLLSGAGGVLALGGTWVGFQIQVREQRRARSEQVSRENLLRLHAERVAGYTDFYREGGEMRAVLGRLAGAPNDDALITEARRQREVLWNECARVTLIGSRLAASNAWALLNYVTDVTHGDAVLDSDQYRLLIWDFILAARADLIFPDEPDTPLAQVWSWPDRNADTSSAPPGTTQID